MTTFSGSVLLTLSTKLVGGTTEVSVVTLSMMSVGALVGTDSVADSGWELHLALS